MAPEKSTPKIGLDLCCSFWCRIRFDAPSHTGGTHNISTVLLFIDRVFQDDDLLHKEQTVGKNRLFVMSRFFQ
jgi:hypothetical protein